MKHGNLERGFSNSKKSLKLLTILKQARRLPLPIKATRRIQNFSSEINLFIF